MSHAPALHISGAAFIGARRLFAPVELEVPAEQWTCLLGASGVGKTTLLRLVAGLQDGAFLDGTIASSDGASLTGRTALMAQDDLLMPWLTVQDNVLLGARLRGQAPDTARARNVLHAVGLAEHATKKPAALSGGERQRAALARTLMEDRPLVLLDEPFSALDARTRAQMQTLAARLLKGRTVLMITHDPAEAVRMSHRAYLLTGEGAKSIDLPDSPTPRAVDDASALTAQGALLAQLMAQA